jgi:hypothetical protein
MDPMFAFCSAPVKRRPSPAFPPLNQWICPLRVNSGHCDVASARKSVVFGRLRERNSPRAVYAMVRAAKFIKIHHKDAEGRKASWPLLVGAGAPVGQ